MLHNVFCFPKNTIYFIILSFSVLTTFFINHAVKFKYQYGSLTLSLLMSYIYIYMCMELLVKPEILKSCVCIYIYIYGCRFGNAESHLYLLHNVSTLNQCRKLSCGILVCKHFASYQGYSNYGWDLIQ
jgi:hypothetical protein